MVMDYQISLLAVYDENNLGYHNVNGIIDTTVWIAFGNTMHTVDIALGLIDSDNWLDVVCANLHYAQPNNGYRNIGGNFTLYWQSTPTTGDGIAYADIDGDNDMDIVIGNESDANMAFMNNNVTIETTPFWMSVPVKLTRDIGPGDLDGDGYPDLACANADTLFIYDNIGETFETFPSWKAKCGVTYQMALGVKIVDLDGDSDLDLLTGRYSAPTMLFLNGLYDTIPPSVQIVYPNEGESFSPGDTIDILWHSQDNIEVTETILLLSFDSGSTYPDTIATPGSDKACSWIVPDTSSANCRIGVLVYDYDRNNQAFDKSDRDFSIVQGGIAEEEIVSSRCNFYFTNPVKDAVYFNFPSYNKGANLSIYDLEGRFVIEKIIDAKIIKWNLRDRNGKMVPQGIYFCRVKTYNNCRTKKLILIK